MKTKTRLQKLVGVIILLLVTRISNGQTLDWAKQIGGTGHDTNVGSVLCIDGGMASTGYFEDTFDFDPGPITLNITSGGSFDAFVVKLDSLGNFDWVHTISGQSEQHCNTITLDSAGYIYLSGDFEGTTNFDPGISNFSLTAISPVDIFIVKLDINGNFIWAKQIGGTTGASPRDIKILDDKLFLTGTFLGTVDFDPGAGTYNLTSFAGGRDAFVCKLDTAGNFIWAKQLGGAGTYQDGNALAIDNTGSVYVTGRFNGTIDLDPGTGVFNVSTPTGNTLDMDAFICKLNVAGDFVWGMKLGSSLDENSGNIILDGLGSVYISGVFFNTIDFDPGAGVFNMTSAGATDFFILKLDTAGNFVWAKRTGNNGYDSAILSRDISGYLYLSGAFAGVLDADPGIGVYNLTASVVIGANAFIVKLDLQGDFLWAINFEGNQYNGIYNLLFDASNHIYARGTFDGTMDCDPGTGVYNFTSNGSSDMFFMRLSQPLVGVLNQQATTVSGITVYPNPTQGVTTVALQKVRQNLNVKIYNSTGQLLQTVMASNTNTLQIALPYKTGIYFAEVVMDDGVRVVKLVVE